MINEDIDALKLMAHEYNNKLHLLIHFSGYWHEAKAYAEKLGGQLLIIEDESHMRWLASNDAFIGSSAWLGLDMQPDGSLSWINGKSVEFDIFKDKPLHLENLTPNVSFRSDDTIAVHWYRRKQGAFIITWDVE